jgi:hypothetical protein
VLLCSVQFFTVSAISIEFGTITFTRSNVSISVERTLILRTTRSCPPMTIQSPAFDRPLGKQDQSGDEIVDDALQAEADAD